MVTKKKVIKKEVVKKEEKPISYKPVFPDLKFKFTKKIDANYYGIKQYLKNVMGLDLFKKTNTDKPKTDSLWLKYCDWWNKTFNGVKS